MGNAAASARAAGPFTGHGQGEAAGRRRRAVGTAGPFQGLRADREQRTPPSTPSGPQYDVSLVYGLPSFGAASDAALTPCGENLYGIHHTCSYFNTHPSEMLVLGL
jgi:hypothetical protein